MKKLMILLALVWAAAGHARESRPLPPASAPEKNPNVLFNQRDEIDLQVSEEALVAEYCGYRGAQWAQAVLTEMESRAVRLATNMFGPDTGASSASAEHIKVYRSQLAVFLSWAANAPAFECSIMTRTGELSALDNLAAQGGYGQ